METRKTKQWRTFQRRFSRQGPIRGLCFLFRPSKLCIYFSEQQNSSKAYRIARRSEQCCGVIFKLQKRLSLVAAATTMEPSAIILIMAPIFFPIAMELGIDPIHFGIIMIVNMEIGLVTPPIGLNLFVASAVTGLPVVKVMKAAFPWLLLLLSFLILVTYVPAISLALPEYLGAM